MNLKLARTFWNCPCGSTVRHDASVIWVGGLVLPWQQSMVGMIEVGISLLLLMQLGGINGAFHRRSVQPVCVF